MHTCWNTIPRFLFKSYLQVAPLPYIFIQSQFWKGPKAIDPVHSVQPYEHRLAVTTLSEGWNLCAGRVQINEPKPEHSETGHQTWWNDIMALQWILKALGKHFLLCKAQKHKPGHCSMVLKISSFWTSAEMKQLCETQPFWAKDSDGDLKSGLEQMFLKADTTISQLWNWHQTHNQYLNYYGTLYLKNCRPGGRPCWHHSWDLTAPNMSTLVYWSNQTST